jgi:signal transduction histidine kinase
MSNQLQGVGELASGVLHDLNQSLAIVIGYIVLAEQSLAEGRVDEVRSRLRLAGQAASDGSAAIDRYLGRGPHDAEELRRPLDIGQTLHEVAHLTAPRWAHAALAEGRHIRIEVEGASGLLIAGCGHRMRAALTNLVFNAIDALPRGGCIRLATYRSLDRVVVEVQDDGTGMAPEVQARCLEPFFTTKGEYGSGLGLAQVQAVLRQYDGRLDLTSVPDRGTLFRLTFPAAPPLMAFDSTTRPSAVRPHLSQALEATG